MADIVAIGEARKGRMRSTMLRIIRDNTPSQAKVVMHLRVEAKASLERIMERAMATIESELMDELPSQLLSVANAGGAATAQSFKQPRKPPTRVRMARAAGFRVLGFAFDRTSPQARAWAARHGGALVVDITEETRRAIRKAITLSFDEGIPVRQAATIIRKSVGLTEIQTEAVINLRARVMSSPGKLVYAGKVPIRVPQNGMPTIRMEKLLSAYSERLTKQRAFVIAQNQTQMAAHQGQLQAWHQAERKGLLTGKEKREWIVSANPCKICSALEGKTATLHGAYEGGISNPPAHPRCVCTEGLAA